MLIFKKPMSNLLENSAVALGFFDGVHLGHQAVINQMLKMSKKLNVHSCVVTFETHPLQILARKPYPGIISLNKRIEIFDKMGVENILLLDFDNNLLSLSAYNYLQNLKNSINPKIISVGFNHHFGNDKKGNREFLIKNETVFDYKSYICPPVEINNEIVSSTLIKKYIKKGNFEKTNTLLGRHFSLTGVVQKGEKIGREIGFATANIEQSSNLVQIPNGVYITRTEINKKLYNSITNIGTAPTLKNTKNLIETHIFNFEKDIYNKEIEIFFIKKLRDEKKFNSKEELINQIKKDCIIAKNTFETV